MAKTDYDVVVAGAGPAGSTAARKLAELDYDVGVFDRATFPRHKTCGGLLTKKTIDLLERVFGYSAATLQDEGILDYTSRGYELNFRDSPLAKGRSNLQFFFVKRTVFDAFLMKQARDEGADVHEGEGVKDLLDGSTGIRTTSGRTITADFVIGCDGVHSSIRRALIERDRLDEPDGDWYHNLAMALEAYVDRTDLSRTIDRPIIHLGVINWGYGWVFPHSDRCLIGIGGLRRKNGNFRDVLDSYRQFLSVEDAEGKVKGHPVPYGNFVFEPYSRNTLLAGDAAGLVDALTAEGIFYAQRTGELAAEAIYQSRKKSTAPGAIYQRLLDDHVFPEMRGSRLLRPLILGGPERLRTRPLRLFSNFFADQFIELIQGERIYNFFRRRGKFRHRLLTSETKSI